MNVALPSIQRKLHFSSVADLQWVVNIYVHTAGGFLPLGGRVAGTFLFAAASLVCGLANSTALLVTARRWCGSAQQPPATCSVRCSSWTAA